MRKALFTTILAITAVMVSCQEGKEETRQLPYLGQDEYDPVTGDTVHHTVADFALLDQDSSLVTAADLKGKVYVADFFFTSCPTMCPRMVAQMKRLQKLTEDLDLTLVSFTIDPKRDVPSRLREFVEENGIDDSNWLFLYGTQDDLDMLKASFKVTVEENDKEPGGIVHSPHFVLVDQDGHIRGMYDGQETKEVDQCVEDIKLLLND